MTTKQLAADMLECMGQRDVLLMQGHGITATGPSVEAATTTAIRFDKVAWIMWQIALSGRDAPDISAEDLERYRRTGREEAPRTGWQALPGVETWGWKHYVRLLQVNNIGLPGGGV